MADFRLAAVSVSGLHPYVHPEHAAIMQNKGTWSRCTQYGRSGPIPWSCMALLLTSGMGRQSVLAGCVSVSAGGAPFWSAGLAKSKP